ncbi:MAG: alpha/beta hydrolase domain-containing protein [Acidimicrobiales bacterium]|nr:alpha/beta hydrolase domain-containing protein [Acidimicrobiales bacterium]
MKLSSRNSFVWIAVTSVVLIVAFASCSKTDTTSPPAASGDGGTGRRSAAATTARPVERPAGPKADLSEELTAGSGPFLGESSRIVGGDTPAIGTARLPSGYIEREFVAAGTATDYRVVGELSRDGRWSFEPGNSAEYRTRVVVRRPEDPGRASGTVVVEWLNVSGGVDANPDYASLEEEIARRGHIWVGVSAQLIGVEGGPVLVKAPGAEQFVGKGLKAIDPARYGSLRHPGDGFAFDIYTQIARALREGGTVLGGATPQVLLAVGESQSAIALTTYYNGVQPLTQAFDGFLIHSRGSVGLPLVGPGQYADLAGSIAAAKPALIRDDLDAPVLELQTEGDVTGILDSFSVRQPDTERFRLWEVAGASHADVHLLGSIAESLNCGVPINDGPMHIVAKAALRSLDRWVRTGDAPPEAPRLEVAVEERPRIKRDEDGIALGGIRTPPVDVPVVVLSGEPGPSQEIICILMGSTLPMPAERIAARYASVEDYLQRFEEETNETIAAGFVLDEDREALKGYAKPELVEAAHR